MRKFYHHRFVWFDETNVLRSVSRPFFSHNKGIELVSSSLPSRRRTPVDLLRHRRQ